MDGIEIVIVSTVSLYSQSYGFPVVMYGCESWTRKKAEHWRTDAFTLWCWRRLLRVSWTAKRSNQSILKEIDPEYSLEGLLLKLKLQYFGHLMQKTDSLEKTLILGKIEGRKRRVQQRMRWWVASLTQWVWVWASSRSWWWTGRPGVLRSTGLQSRTWLSNWTELTETKYKSLNWPTGKKNMKVTLSALKDFIALEREQISVHTTSTK